MSQAGSYQVTPPDPTALMGDLRRPAPKPTVSARRQKVSSGLGQTRSKTPDRIFTVRDIFGDTPTRPWWSGSVTTASSRREKGERCPRPSGRDSCELGRPSTCLRRRATVALNRLTSRPPPRSRSYRTTRGVPLSAPGAPASGYVTGSRSRPSARDEFLVQRRQRRAGRYGPLSGSRVRDRCAPALISLSLDEIDGAHMLRSNLRAAPSASAGLLARGARVGVSAETPTDRDQDDRQPPSAPAQYLRAQSAKQAHAWLCKSPDAGGRRGERGGVRA
jgi:hypothetical protein